MQIRGFRGVNIEAALKVFILSGFSLFFYSIIHSGKVQLYVHPRIVPYMEFGILAMVSISLFTLKELFKPKRKYQITSYLFFIIPLFLAFLLPPKSMDSSSMSFGDMKIARQTKGPTSDTGSVDKADNSFPDDDTASTDSSSNSDNPSPSFEVNSSNYEALASLAREPSARVMKLQNGMVVMGDDNFVKWLQELDNNREKYQGKRIQVVGFVFKDNHLKKNEFIPARLMMTCCAADLQPVGMLCRYDKAAELKHDTWVKVTGTIKVIDYKGEKVPIIEAESVVKTSKPNNDYVYPF
jgi:putative membrane protein